MRRWPLVFVAMLTACSTGNTGSNVTGAGPVPADIRAVFDKPLYGKATWGLRVLDGTHIIIDYNSDRQFFIGSVRKIFTVGSLLNTVSARHTYDTPVYRQGAIDGMKTLHGNLIVVASGDFTMGGRTNPDGTITVSDWDHNEADSLGNAILTAPDPLAGYLRLARAVKAAGIDCVAGDVVIDDRLFQPFEFRGQFQVRPIFVNDDVVDLSITPSQPGSPAKVAWRPKSAALSINNKLVTGQPNSANTLKLAPELPQCIGSSPCVATIQGSLPSNFVPPLTGRPVLVQTVRIVQPANYARTVFIESLAAAGVTVGAPPVEPNPVRLLPPKGSYPAGNKVAELTGMPYGQDAKLILKISYNIGADTSLVLWGLTRGADSMSGALAAEQTTLAQRYGVPKDQYHFVDGSGGEDTTATNAAVTRMLDWLAQAREHEVFYNDLPILAVDGSLATVKDFEKDATLAGAAGQVHAKTGTYVGGSQSAPMLKGQAFGGYITTKSGKHLVYQLVVNNVPIKNILDVITVFQDEGTISAMLWRDN